MHRFKHSLTSDSRVLAPSCRPPVGPLVSSPCGCSFLRVVDGFFGGFWWACWEYIAVCRIGQLSDGSLSDGCCCAMRPDRVSGFFGPARDSNRFARFSSELLLFENFRYVWARVPSQVDARNAF